MSINKYALPCECVSTCGIALVVEFEAFSGDPQEFFVEFYTRYDHTSLRDRLSTAWRIVRGKDPWMHDVSLTAAQMDGLRDWLIARGSPTSDATTETT